MHFLHRKDEVSLHGDNNVFAAGDSVAADHDGPPLRVVLTGSTGNLGAYLLDTLLSDPRVVRVYCLNRSGDAKERQSTVSRARGLLNEFDSERVVFLQADYERDKLGLADEWYETLADEADVLIHNAWPVDFNRNFSSFKPSIEGVQNLVRFSQWRTNRGDQTSRRRGRGDGRLPSEMTEPIRFVFISSIGTVSNWSSYATTSRVKVPEAEMRDWKLARTGYGQAKLLCERLLAHSARESGLAVTVLRVGQLAGPVLRHTHGQWTDREWIPSIIRSSIALGAIPSTLGPANCVDWVPVDIAAQICVEMTLADQDLTPSQDRHRSSDWSGLRRPWKKSHRAATFYHVSNPHTINWDKLVPTIQHHVHQPLRPIAYAEWVDLLRKSADENTNENKSQKESSKIISPEAKAGGDDSNPAVKLLDFFEYLQRKALQYPKAKAAELDTKKSAKASPTLAHHLRPVSEEWMELWLRQWSWA